ncbi:GDSL esterase/lipase 7-like isoform X1 [Telopea speciosissima]|uniref:GDSL esterase/lipase 7-like isoform X1 n=1 Tax=Telopea speciosissima TaxID=54955 RepID=UPI001CC467D0|nr:GDSL esterase/lipase 7-like isoform X1 [Telopea speciosissima]
MANTFPLFLRSLCLFPLFFLANCSSPLAPALYVFGDSLVDSGNNNFLNTTVKANYKPYGIDFAAGPTGRFTNGNTFADFLAQYLGLPFVPPYLGLSKSDKSKTITGINYASGSAGILQESGKRRGVNLPLKKQIEFFQETVNHYLPKNFKTKHELSQYLSKSVFVVEMGTNDYLANYLQPAYYNSSYLYNPVQFSGILLKKIKQNLQDLYNLGARKFVVFNIMALGCTPAELYIKNLTSGCAEDVNQIVSLYNEGLPDMLQELNASLQCSTFVLGDIYGFIYDLSQNPYKYGFTDRGPCCVIDYSTYLCQEDVTPCVNRTSNIFWDTGHRSQQTNLLLATDCFSGTTQCTPLNILQLMQK